MSKCLYCYLELEPGQVDFHPGCARKVFGMKQAPQMPYTRDNMSELARKVIRTSASVTGVQAKMSLDVDRGGKNEPARFTIVGLWGKYIFKPQSPLPSRTGGPHHEDGRCRRNTDGSALAHTACRR